MTGERREDTHPRTYSLVGSPHLYLVSDDESGINIGYADRIGGPLMQAAFGDEVLWQAVLEVWISVPATCDPDDPMVQCHAKALDALIALASGCMPRRREGGAK